MPLSLLVVDDDQTVRETLVEFFEALGHVARGAGTATEGRRLVAEHAPDVVLVDLRLPDASGLTLFEALRADDPGLGVIFLTGHADVATAVEAMRRGAVDFLEKPVDLQALEGAVSRAAELGRLRREVALLRARDADAHADGHAGGLEASLDRLIELAARNDDAPVLLQGETGTGKGWVARRIHERSARAAKPFVEINCASLSATFVESELFGHEKGAFTDARQAKRGLLEVAGEGTVFLDEIAELAPEVQPRLLKVIEEQSFRRLGGTTTLRSSARVVCATHQPLEQATRTGRFRADLYYRLQVLTIVLPPLRARAADVPALARELLPRGATLADETIPALVAYRWPGNIRELKNTLWRASILADGAPIRVEHLGLPAAANDGVTNGGANGAHDDVPLTLDEAELRAIRAALRATQGNKARAAQLLGIARSTLQEKVRKLGIE
jgi:DNA-binding NtrC family response regulator